MRNLDRGYWRIAFTVGTALDAVFMWLLMHAPDNDTGLMFVQEPRDWVMYGVMGLAAIIAFIAFTVIVWAILWVVTGLGIWLKRGFEN